MARPIALTTITLTVTFQGFHRTADSKRGRPRQASPASDSEENPVTIIPEPRSGANSTPWAVQAPAAQVAAAVDSTVKPVLTAVPTGRRKGGAVENKEFCSFARRIVRAFSRRVASGDVEALADLVAMSHQLDEAITHAVLGLREQGYSWSEIADRLGTTKQAAHSRWSKLAAGQRAS
jgi:DNA-directed RNA polymerase specialized sigma24 family protein